ncbi:MAG: RNA polymerase sigma factor [Chloroflexota bacterium]|nr:RNA polymerase sigma factor [Chloroflexota bacterium]
MSGSGIDADERARLVGLCAHLTGDTDATEDLAHEVVAIALRGDPALRDPSRRRQWMSGIARNVCRRWVSRKVGDHLVVTSEALEWEENLADRRIDIERELERAELLDLLDRALGALPDPTRRVLVARLAEGLPQREVAERLGMSETAVATRLLRGKEQLRRVLLTGMPKEAAEYGLLPASGEWEETRIWCPACGGRRLLGRFAPDRHGLWLRCPGCGDTCVAYTEHGDFDEAHPGFFHGLKGYKPSLNRVLAGSHELHARASADPLIPCPGCREPVRVRFDPEGLTAETWCACCGSSSRNDAAHLVHALPEARRFWREHPRMRTLPPRSLEHGGRDAVLLTLESLGGASRLHVIMVRDTLQVLAICGDLHP